MKIGAGCLKSLQLAATAGVGVETGGEENCCTGETSGKFRNIVCVWLVIYVIDQTAFMFYVG